MTDDPIGVEELTIRRAPGFESEGFAVEDICSGINIVHGPNATGKTTVAKSIERLFWPEATEGHAELVARLSVNGDAWRVELNGSRTSYQQDGKDVNRPNLPPVDQRDRYRLSLHTLLQQETRNATFAETIERESAGGYDLADARDELGYADSTITRGKGVVKDAEQAVEDLRDAQSNVSTLRRKQDQLARLRDDLEDARRAKERVELLEQAISYVEARDKLEAAEAELEAFPEVLERVNGDEADEVVKLEEQLQEWTEKKTKAEDAKDEAEQELEDAGLSEDGLPDGRLQQLKGLQDKLESFETRSDSLKSELTGAKGKRANARNDIPLDVTKNDLSELDPVSWKDVSKFARKAEEVRAKRESRTAVEELLENDEEHEQDLQTLQRGSQFLEEWLATASPSASNGGDAAFRVALVSAALLSAAGLALGVLVNPVLLVTLLAAAGVLLYGHRSRTSTDEESDPRKPHRDSFEQTRLGVPDSWTVDGVRARLTELNDSIAQQQPAVERDQRREALTANGDQLEEDKQSLEATRAKLRESLGAAPDTTDVELTVITKRVLEWQKAHDEVVRLQDELDAVEEQLDSAKNELQSKVQPYGYEDVESAPAAKEAIRNLEQRNSQHETAQSDLERAKQTISEANEKVEELRSDRDQIFTTLDLAPGDHDELQALCEQIEDFEDAKTTVETASALAENEAGKLENLPGYEHDLKERAIPELREEQRQAEETAAGYDDTQTKITEIETRIDDAKTDDTVENAITEKERALDALQEQFDDDYSSTVGDVLVDHVQETTMDASRPAVFQRAREILTTITGGRYRLDLAEEETTFRAFDTAKQKGFALDELSSATRVQVLLAVRIAFIEQQEQGIKLPLLLDETLANTDDHRATVIIESMIELARDGRQVFYFTAQGDEVAKWLNALEETATIDHNVTDLANARGLEKAVQIPDVDGGVTLTPDLPSPDAHDHATYRDALGVEPFDPHQGVGTAHLWYVVEDVELLHQLLELGIERWGPLNNLLERGSEEIVVEETDRLEPVRQNAEALDAFVAAWKVGRGKPVERQVLESSGAVSSRFIDEVVALAESVGNDGERVIDALRDGEVNRFQTGKINDLETYFEDCGYIEPSASLDGDQIRIRVIEGFVDAGVSRECANEKATTLLTRLSETTTVEAIE
ncbi:AAA family ATPase [Haladaptatus salinisoli]|uniref:AAA family ATPase n=1 Tax=Haladaptatus salinisoli TaxID=2884876 RepID=UPI001D0A7468|nr:AAA family ATPase [Haladaptatus salinisoli]